MWSAAAIWDGAESVLAADGGARGAPVLTLPRGEQGPLELPDPGLHPGLDVLLSCPLLPAPDPSFPPPVPSCPTELLPHARCCPPSSLLMACPGPSSSGRSSPWTTLGPTSRGEPPTPWQTLV